MHLPLDAGVVAVGAVPPAIPELSRPFGVPQADKRRELLQTLSALTEWHRQRCEPYGAMLSRLYSGGAASTLEDLPLLPVRLFKNMLLSSVPDSEVFKTLVSSGTTGQAVSRIILDRNTAALQSRVLASIVADFIGSRRAPMVIIDSAEQLKDRSRFNARAAGILGFSPFGRQHHYCLDASLRLDAAPLEKYLARHAGEPILAFGFTFVVWQGLYEEAVRLGRTFSFGAESTLIHGGGWKRLVERQVDNDTFKERLRETCGFERVLNYYGMVEQVGSVFMECEHGRLHAPVFADVIVRDPVTLEPLPMGHSGVIQVVSVLPRSYPGHSLLTEDVGVVLGEDDCPCGRLGRTFAVSGRLPEAEARGCSDTRMIP
jgi:Acyl-protein synthetase, LuxE